MALTSLLDREVSDSEAKKFAKKYDTDGDGVISFEEFDALVESAKSGVKSFFDNLFNIKSKEAEAAKETIMQKEAGF